MSDKILEAVKALGGDLANAVQPDCLIEELRKMPDGRFIITANDDYHMACTTSEFNTAAEEWLKEAYMHNAAIDLEWDINNSFHYDGEKYLFRNNDTGVYVDSDDKSDCNGMYTLICKSQEFIDYCAENKPNPKPAFTQAMAGAGELPPVGCECTLRYMHDSKTVTHTGLVLYASRKYCILDQVGDEILCKIGDYAYEPIKSPRDKAVEVISEKCKLTGLHSTSKGRELVSGAIYDWLKQLTPEQRKEFDL
jgi:hypothetical protein